MTNGQFLLSWTAVVCAVVIVLVEGRRTVAAAALAAAVALVPSAVLAGGAPAALIPVSGAVAAAVFQYIARVGAERLPWVPGLDPIVPVVAAPDGLFGPRSVRMAALLFGLPAMSWISLNVRLLGGTTARGVVFAAGYIWIAGAVRLLLARTVVDLAAGSAVVALASGVAWTAQGGAGADGDAAALAVLASFSGAVAGWLRGRHHRQVSGHAPAAQGEGGR